MLVEQLKKEAMKLRKERSPIAASITFALSEIEKVGKNAGNRVTTEDEAIKVVQKLVATLCDNLTYKLTESDEANTRQQIQILESVLPQMVSDEAIVAYLKELDTNNKGAVMKAVKAHFGALVDMKRVGTLLESINE